MSSQQKSEQIYGLAISFKELFETVGKIYCQRKRTTKTQAVCLELGPFCSISEFPLPTQPTPPAGVIKGAFTGAFQSYLTFSIKLITFSGLTCAITYILGGKGVLDRGGGGGLLPFFPWKGGLIRGRGAYLTGGVNIGFTVHFTIIGVKKIIRRFFKSWFHCIRAYRYIVLCWKNIFLVLVALADTSTKLRILIIHIFCFYSYRRCRVSFFLGIVSFFAV